MRDALMASGYDGWVGMEAVAHHDPLAYVALLRDWSEGHNLPASRQPGPADAFWITEGDTVVGQCDVRHTLSPKFELFGGHIGYSVHPAYRNKGIATFAVREVLSVLAKAGLSEALVTCADDNVASIRVIEKCGGRRIADTMRPRPNVSSLSPG